MIPLDIRIIILVVFVDAVDLGFFLPISLLFIGAKQPVMMHIPPVFAETELGHGCVRTELAFEGLLAAGSSAAADAVDARLGGGILLVAAGMRFAQMVLQTIPLAGFKGTQTTSERDEKNEERERKSMSECE